LSVGEQEIAEGTVAVRDLRDPRADQETVERSRLVDHVHKVVHG
jgi:hypothetical protein